MDVGDTARLSYPVGYWNAMAALGVMALPLLVGYAGCSVTPQRRFIAMAGLPPVLLATYLTFSRAGLLFALVAIAVLLALSGQRIRVLLALVIGLVDGAVAVAAALAMPALVQGEQSAEAEALGLRLLVVVALVAIVAGFLHEALHRLIVRRRLALPGSSGGRRSAWLVGTGRGSCWSRRLCWASPGGPSTPGSGSRTPASGSRPEPMPAPG